MCGKEGNFSIREILIDNGLSGNVDVYGIVGFKCGDRNKVLVLLLLVFDFMFCNFKFFLLNFVQ
jgi:hypothetical protein